MTTSVELRTERDNRHFDRWARRYDHSPTQAVLFGPVQRSVVGAITPRLPESGTMLDIGCGTGRLLERLHGAHPRATLFGLDRSAGMADAARKLRPYLAVGRGSADALPYRDGTFDAVVTTISFHHWPHKPACITEVFRVLRVGGLFALTDISVDDLPSWPAPLWAPARRAMDDMPPLDERDRLLRAAGFDVVERVRTFHRRWITLTIAERPGGSSSC